jgi:apoptosis-inducing factor 2
VFTQKQAQSQDEPTQQEDTATKRHLFLQAQATALTPYSLTLDRPFPEHGFPTSTIEFDYLVYALGARLPDPINVWTENSTAFAGADEQNERSSQGQERQVEVLVPGSKANGIAWLKRHQEVVKDASSVLVVGGGALGIRE